jgi:phage terminase large subunit
MAEITIPYKPRPLQREIHKSLKRWNLLVCHRRFGKTVFAINELIKQAAKNDKKMPRYAYVAPYYKQAKQIAWDYLKDFTRPIPGIKVNESELRVDFPWGARIQLFGADSPDSMRGLYLDGVVLDEYADMSPRIFSEVLRPALSDREGSAIFIGSAKGGTPFYDLWERVKDEPDWFVKVYPASETGVIAEGELEDARKIMDEDEFNQEYECSWTASIKGAYYGKQLAEAQESDRIGKVPCDPRLPVHTAWDLGVGDSTAIWFYQVLGQEIRIIDFHEDSGEGLPYYAKILDQKGYKYGDHWAPHDIQVRELGSGKSRIETAKMLGITFRIVPNLSIDDGINAVRNTIPRCWFDAKACELGLQALRNYRKEYDDRRQEYKPRPLHDWSSHAADAFRYLAVSLKDKQKAQTIKQPRVQIA